MCLEHKIYPLFTVVHIIIALKLNFQSWREKLISNLGRAAARVSRAPSADFIEKTLKSTRIVILKLGQPKLADGNLQLFCVQNSFQK